MLPRLLPRGNGLRLRRLAGLRLASRQRWPIWVTVAAATFSTSTADTPRQYPIGTPGQPWGVAERQQWRSTREVKNSYEEEVLVKVRSLAFKYTVEQYGSLSQDPDRYPLYSIRTSNWQSDKPYVLITGGVHGYERSGVHGVLLFLQTMTAHRLSETFNIMVIPCISPWGYETVQRWNEDAVDPNRGFNPDGEVVEGRSFNPEPATEESRLLMAYLASLNVEQWLCHFDLHETTDTDETEFMPAKAARDGREYVPEKIPDGFYLVADETNPQPEWHASMITAVREVMHIAPADAEGKIIGEPVVQEGVIAIPSPRSVGLCAGMTNAKYATTTEVYPDSPKAHEQLCNRAQVQCIVAGLEHILKVEGLQRRTSDPQDL